MTCGENSMALVGFLLAPSVSAKSKSSAEPAIAGLWVKPLTDTVREHQNTGNKGFRIACDKAFPRFKLFGSLRADVSYFLPPAGGRK